ncbi:MAG: hypothetical protein HY360_08860 [Verrucomicrobia bacterium]|nr:hypothetical protein [Verrucomicrobiota bacterium]
MSAPLEFLKFIRTRLRADGIRFALTSGMACVHYGLQQTTKDSDWIIVPDDLARFRKLIGRIEKEAAPLNVSYRAIFGAPLERNYLAHGWTSHLRVTEPDGAEQKLDIFGKPPRVSRLETEPDDPDYASRHVVALMKRTDRDRDWPIVFGCGVQMLERKDPRGVLHLQEANWLRRAWQSAPAEYRVEFQRMRPILRFVEKQPQRLRRLLVVERALWEAANRTRYRPFEKAWKNFYRNWRREPGQNWPVKTPFADQHQLLLDACRRHKLPADPLACRSRQQRLLDAQADVSEAEAATPDELADVTPPIEVLYP